MHSNSKSSRSIRASTIFTKLTIEAGSSINLVNRLHVYTALFQHGLPRQVIVRVLCPLHVDIAHSVEYRP